MPRKKIPISEKKVQVSIYPKQSEIDVFGGIEQLKTALLDFINKQLKNIE